MKRNENMYFAARKNAAKSNDRLSSREKAAELLGVHESSLADYELDNVKVVPVDRVNAMADLYHCPELKARYCKYVCPLGQDLPMATDISDLEKIVLRVIGAFDEDRVAEAKRSLIDIAMDGKVDESEVKKFGSVIGWIDSMMMAISELKMFSEKIRREEDEDF